MDRTIEKYVFTSRPTSINSEIRLKSQKDITELKDNRIALGSTRGREIFGTLKLVIISTPGFDFLFKYFRLLPIVSKKTKRVPDGVKSTFKGRRRFPSRPNATPFL